MPSPNIFLFTGEDTYRLHEKVKLWEREFIKKYGDTNNISFFEAPAASLNECIDSCRTLPFLADKRLIFIENALSSYKDEEQKKLAKLLEEMPDTSIMVFIEKNEIPDKRTVLYKKILDIGKVECFAELNNLGLVGWIQQYVQRKNGLIKRENADFIIKHLGNNQWHIQQELDKKLAYCENTEITKETVQLLTKANIKTTIFKFTDALGQKNTRLSLNILHTLLESGEDIFYIFHMIVRQFRLLIQVKDLMEKKWNASKIIAELKKHPFVISTLMAQGKNFSMEKLKSVYEKLLEIEIHTKTGKIKTSTYDTAEFNLAVERLILESCRY